MMGTDKSMDIDLATKDQEDKNKNKKNLEATEANRLPLEIKDSLNHNRHVPNKREVAQVNPDSNDTSEMSCEFNMEAAMTADDVTRAGGFGARDDIGSFLPTAIDSTDFEASIRDAQDFEEPQAEKSRPGLGWNETKGK